MPTTNPVPSTDPSDLLFNAGKLDEVVNGTANSFTDRLGATRRTVAGMNADFDAQLADAESDLNVYRADAAASAAEALGYLQTIRATSYGAYAEDPTTDPLGNPPTVGDEYFNTTSNLLKRWNGTTWQASDINTANLAASSGSSLVGYDGGTVQDVLDGAKSLQDYAALRAYSGRATRIYIAGLLVTAKPAGIAGSFQFDPTDTTSADNGGTIIVGADGRRWKRDYGVAVNLKWFGIKADGSDEGAMINSVLNLGLRDYFAPSGNYGSSVPIVVKSNTTLKGVWTRTVFTGINVVGALLSIGTTALPVTAVIIENLMLAGTATKACSFDHATLCNAKNIWAAGAFTDGFYFDNVYPGEFTNFYTNGAVINGSCFEFGNEVNACVFNNFYTSNFSTNNFYINGSGHGNTFNNPTAQGGRVGFYVRSTGFVGGITVNGLYVENVPRPIVVGDRDLTKGAFAVTFNSPMLTGPFASHPYYSESIAAIELNYGKGILVNEPMFLGTYRTAGGFASVTITGDGTGAKAHAIVSPSGEINSVSVIAPGSGYTTCTATIATNGGPGSGATLTTTLSGGKLSAITVTAAGSGYKRLQTPMAVMYQLAVRCKIIGGVSDQYEGLNAPIHTLMCRLRDSAQAINSTISWEDTSVWVSANGSSAIVQKVAGSSSNFAVTEFDSTGTQVTHVYSAPAYP